MKKILLLALLFSTLLQAQYYNERTTEQSFENSPLYFNSAGVNTFGLNDLDNIIPGLLNDPFMDLYLNPANLPDLKGKEMLLYFDFTGDREEEEIIRDYSYPHYYLADMNYAPVTDPRWLNISRSEPSPLATLGILANPLGKDVKQFVAGLTYQLIHKEERFYNIPYWIYNYNPYLDSFNSTRMEGNGQDVPVIDRYTGEDFMTTDGHLLNTFFSYKLSENLSLGIGLSGVWHSRDGSYLNQQQNEYGNFNETEWANSQAQGRKQEYSHFDLSGGVKYYINDKSNFGLKFGYLKGTARQNYYSENSYTYQYSQQSNSDNWSNNFSESSSAQSWKHEGHTKYLGIYFKRKFDEDTSMKLFYRLSSASLDLTSTSSITDTSFYESHWHYSNYDDDRYNYSTSTTDDLRNSFGDKLKDKHEIGLYLNWNINPIIKFSAGIYYQNLKTEISTNEPVSADRYSFYENTSSMYENYSNSFHLIESKTLEWNYNSRYWTVQIPAILEIKSNEAITIMLGVNRKLEAWNMEDETTAYFQYRDENSNGAVSREENFGERYIQPKTNISENRSDFFAGFKVLISDLLKIRLLVDPDWDDKPKFSQWHLSFYGLL